MTDKIIWVCLECKTMIQNDETKYDPHSKKCEYFGDPNPFVPLSTLETLQKQLDEIDNICNTFQDSEVLFNNIQAWHQKYFGGMK